MINFFRKTRQNMIKENKVSKYMLYAIGEIVLVVIGILIALSINNWNQERIIKIQEKQILRQLLHEYNNNLDQLTNKIDLRNGMIKSTLWILNQRDIAEKNINVESVNVHISRILTTPTFDPELGVTNELTNSGKLYYLTNSELRKSITAFPSFLDQLREEEEATLNLIQSQLTPFLITNYQIGPIVEKFYIDNNFNTKQLLNDTNRIALSKDLFKNGNSFDLINNADFEDYLALILSNTDFTNLQSLGVKNHIKLIISLINKDLDKENTND